MCRFKIVMALCVFFVASLSAQEEMTVEEKSAIDEQVSLVVDQAVSENVTPLLVAKSLNLKFPPDLPKKSTDQLEKDLELIVSEKVDKKFPKSIVDKHKAEAYKKYPLYKKGDKVTVRIRPTGRLAVVSGEYRGINRHGELRIGSYDVPKVDMTEDVMVYFDKKLSQKKLKKYIENKLFYYHEDRKTYRKALTPRERLKLYKASGYFPFERKFVPADEYLKKSVELSKTKYREKMTVILQEAEYRKKGFIKKEGKWVKEVEGLISFSADESVEDGAPKEPTVEEKIESEKLPVRKREPLFDNSFYDPDF